jgi:hypothetical protein
MNRRRWSVLGGVAAASVIALAAVLFVTSDDGESAGDVARSTETVASALSSDQPATSTLITDPAEEPASQGASTATNKPPSPPPTLAEVPVGSVVELPPISFDETGDFGNGLTVRLVELTSVTGEATGPGQVAGPAIRVTVEVANTTDRTLSLAQTMVDLSHGEDRVPGMPLSGPGVTELPDSLPPGANSTASVVFGVPLDRRDQIRVVIRDNVDAPVIVFEGAGP